MTDRWLLTAPANEIYLKKGNNLLVFLATVHTYPNLGFAISPGDLFRISFRFEIDRAINKVENIFCSDLFLYDDDPSKEVITLNIHSLRINEKYFSRILMMYPFSIPLRKTNRCEVDLWYNFFGTNSPYINLRKHLTNIQMQFAFAE